MPDDDQDDSQKTQDPTQKRLDDALKKGQVPNSREVTSFIILLVFAMTILWFSPGIMKQTTVEMLPYIESPHTFKIDSQSILFISKKVLLATLAIMVIPVVILIISIYISSLLQHPIIFSPDVIMPKLERISVFKGIKRIFSMKNFVEFIKGVLKISMIGIVAYLSIYSDLEGIMNIQSQSIMAILLLLAKLATKIMVGICFVMFVVAVADYIYQKYEHIKSLRMSFKDLKDEFKQTEGSPEVKAKLREIRNKRAQGRMMAAVPDADVVVTNPTHYSVALKYEEDVNQAPMVVAKGMDLIALKIREVAKENDVPLVENAPLARALYASVELEQEVPIEHYQAVAEIIRYVYKLKGKKNKAA